MQFYGADSNYSKSFPISFTHKPTIVYGHETPNGDGWTCHPAFQEVSTTKFNPYFGQYGTGLHTETANYYLYVLAIGY